MRVELKELEKYNRFLKDWKLKSIEPNLESEGLYYLNFTDGKTVRRLKIFGNDLGGWIKIDGNMKNV